MAEDIVSIGIALDTSKVLAGTKQVDTALKQVAAASTSTAQATQKVDAAAKTAGQALTAESQAAQATANALKQTATAATAASQAAQAAAKAAQSVADALRQTDKAAQGASQQLGGMGTSLRSFASQTASFALAQAGVAGFQQALSTAKDAVVDLVRTGIQMQNLRTSFAAVSGGATAGAKDFQFVVKTATQLGLSLQSVAEQYRSLSAATRGTTLQGADTRELFTTLSKAAQAYGLSTEQLGRAMTAFQQIISKGKVTMEELRGQLGEAIPGAMQIAARAYGTNTQALEDMISKGVAAEGFTRRFMAQLGSEVPQAADRAGKGIANFGTEILLLKEKMAQSGLIRWIDTIIGKLAELLRLGREGQEKIDRAARREATREVGGTESMDALAAKDAQTLTDKTKELRIAREHLRDTEQRLATAREQAAGRGRFTQGTSAEARAVELAKQEVARLQQERTTLISQGRISTAEREEQAARGPLDPTRQRTRQYSFAGQAEQVADLNTFLKEAKAREDAARKAEEAQKAASRAGLGRDPTLEEKVKLQEKLVKDNQEWLETNQKMAEQAKDDPAVKALRERGKAQEAATKGLVDAKQATQDAGEAERERTAKAKAFTDEVARQEEQIKKTQGSELEAYELDMRNKGYQGAQLEKLIGLQRQLMEARKAKEAGEKAEQDIEQLRRMAAQYVEVKTSRDADTASTLAASLATSKHSTEAEKLLTVIKAQTQALEERRKVEEKLPGLREEAQASAGVLADLDRLQKQLEPSRRSMSPEERLAGTRAEIAAKSGYDPARLKRADDQIKETLDTELWDKWRDAGLDALDHVGKALEDFVFKGKLNFKDLLGSIAQDIFRIRHADPHATGHQEGRLAGDGAHPVAEGPGARFGGGGAGADPGARGYDAVKRPVYHGRQAARRAGHGRHAVYRRRGWPGTLYS